MKWLYESANLALKSVHFVATNLAVVIRCFWPAMLLLVLLTVSDLFFNGIRRELAGESGRGLALLVFNFALTVYWMIVLASCAIRWHRFVQLGEEPGWSSLALSIGTRRYFWNGVLFTLLMIPFMLPAYFLMRGSFGSSPGDHSARGQMFELPFAQQIELYLLFGAGGLVMLLILARMFLVFPHIAVDSTEYAELRKRLDYPWRFVGAAIIGYVIFQFAHLFIWQLLPIPWLTGERFPQAVVLSILGAVIGQYFGAWIITVMSLEYRTQLRNLYRNRAPSRFRNDSGRDKEAI